MFSVRMDEGLKEEFGSLCEAFGVGMTAAINMFAKAVVRERRMPFEITADPISRSDAMNNYLEMRSIRPYVSEY